MAELLKCKSRLEAWMAGAQHLLDGKSGLNLSLEISDPTIDGPKAAEARTLLDRFLLNEDQYPLHTVAETIFPGWQYKHRGPEGVFKTYVEEEYPQLRRGRQARWGTYAERLLRVRPNLRPEGSSQLSQLVGKLARERALPGPKRACYEVGLYEPGEMPLYDPAEDATLRMGGPCLSHLSFKLMDGELHLTALYRHHCYRYKVAGNLLGLARLQAFVAEQAGIGVGTLVVHSTLGFLAGAQDPVRLLLRDIRALRPEDTAHVVAD